jgi:transglutaminase-like putative cysteine protease
MVAALVVLAFVPAPVQADEPDGVIEQWDQRWTLSADGSCVYWERKHVRLNSERTYDEFADPRITYNEQTDKVDVLVARTRLPDGSYVETPNYGYNLVTPSSAAGRPAFASWRQLVVTMSGVAPPCVVELEYTVTTKAGTWPYIAGDLRLDHAYPILRRSITIEVPADVPLEVALTNVPAELTEERVERDPARNVITHQVVVRDLPAFGHDPQAPPWQECCPRLTFSTAGSADKWLADVLKRIESFADESELITTLAQRWTEGQSTASDKLRAIQDKLAASFNFVSFDFGWGPPTIRPASQVLSSNYGLPEEAAAVMLALCRAAEVDARPAILVPQRAWTETTPQHGWVDGYVLLLNGVDGPEVWHPQHGRIQRSTRWNGYLVFSMTDGQRDTTRLDTWTAADDSQCLVSGSITVDEKAQYAGTLSLRTTGLFVSAEGLRTNDGQRKRIEELVHHLLPEAKVGEFTVETLSPGAFQVEVEVASPEPLKKIEECHPLLLAEDGPHLADVPMPLAYSTRSHPVRLAGAFDERVELAIEWPPTWAAEVRPISIAKAGDGWSVEQLVKDVEHGVRLQRHTWVAVDELPAESFLVLRDGENALRTDAARTVLLRP